jgi:hypothetical protein
MASGMLGADGRYMRLFTAAVRACIVCSRANRRETSYPACNTGATPCCTRGSNAGWRYAMLIIGFMTLGA